MKILKFFSLQRKETSVIIDFDRKTLGELSFSQLPIIQVWFVSVEGTEHAGTLLMIWVNLTVRK